MLDIRYIRENPELVAQKAKQKGYDVDIGRLVELDSAVRIQKQRLEDLRRQRNELSHGITGEPSADQVAKGKELRSKIAETEEGTAENLLEIQQLLKAVPNVFPDDTPLGGEENNREEKKWGDTGPKDFKVIDHLTWGEQRGLIDFERGAKVAGNKFYFLKGSLVELELAIFQLGLQLAKSHGFVPTMVPHLVNSRIIEGAGFLAKGEERQIYKIENEDLNLIATAEIPLTGYHADEILAGDDLPKLYAGLSPAYRVEAGAYGKHSQGLYRVHQFDKLELYVFCRAEESESWHQKLLAAEEELCQKLGLPYRVVRMAAGELGAPAYKKYDVEYWTPFDETYRELMSCSNVTDYQARRLNIRYKTGQGEISFVHTLNATAAAISRLTIAIIENFQTADGKVDIPEALRSYMAGVATI